MIIEFVGESGCGKSTLADFFLQNTSYARKKKIHSKRENINVLFQILLDCRCRRLYFDLLRLSVRTNGFKRLGKNSYYLLGIIHELHLSEHSNGDIVIIDQGIIQYLHTLYFYKEPEDVQYKKIIQELLKWDVRFVFCSCPIDILKERIKLRMRNGNESPRRIESANRDIIEMHQRTFHLFSDQIPNEKCLRLDTSNNITENSRMVNEFICGGR